MAVWAASGSVMLGCAAPVRDLPEGDPGKLVGQVRLAGSEIPAPTRIENTTDPQVCGREHSLDEILVDPGSRGVANAFVVLEPSAGAASDTTPPAAADASAAQTLVLDNVGCRFEPAAAIVPVGTVLETVNSDDVLHTVHLYGPTEINLALPARGMRVESTLEAPGIYAVRCDVHGWMQALIRVVEAGSYALTDAQGEFRMDSLDPGDYVLEVWHERLGSRSSQVRIGAGELVETRVDFELENETG